MEQYILNAAGFMTEANIWKLIKDIAQVNSARSVTPYHIVWDGSHFSISSISVTEEQIIPFTPPQSTIIDSTGEKYRVWQLGATVFYMFMGCMVFSGKGYMNQKSKSPLPYMRKSMPELSNLVCRMLEYEEHRRPSMKEIFQIATTHLQYIGSLSNLRPQKTCRTNDLEIIQDFWPYEIV